MKRTKRFRLPILVTVAISTSFCAVARSASSAKHWVDHIPLRDGIWEQGVSEGTQVVVGPFRTELCPASSSWQPFPSVPLAQNFGRTLPEEIIGPDPFWKLPDGRYGAGHGVTTTRGGVVTDMHLITLHGDDHYEDVLTVTDHARTHPIKHLYTGRGHWVAPCPAPESRLPGLRAWE